jgi:Family of unknown function (DUF6544)
MVIATLIALLILGGLIVLRRADLRADASTWQELIRISDKPGGRFDPAMVENLPDPARRYFMFSIAPGAPLVSAVEIEMQGELGLGAKDKPNYQPMTARQILAPPFGFVWRVRVGLISGSDGATPNSSWTRFWLFGLLPIVRVKGDINYQRSAFGRFIAEGVFWVPAALLPGEHVRWEPIDDCTARVVVSFGKFEQAVDLGVADDGAPKRVVMQRWSNENAEKEFRYQPFGGELGEFRAFGGYTLPTSVDGGNHIGTEEYFPFYRARVTEIRLLRTI